MKKKNRVIAIAVALGMVFSTTIQTGYVEAKAKPKLSRKKVTVYVGKSATVSVKKAKGYKVKWKATVKSVVKLKKKGKFSVKITAKKAGTTKVKACLTKKRSKKTLSCKVVVKKKNDSQQNATPAPSKVPVNAQNNIVKLVLTKAAATSYTLSGDMNNVEFYNDGLIYSSKPKNSQMAGSVYDNGCGFYLNAGKKVVNLKTLGFKYIALRVKN